MEGGLAQHEEGIEILKKEACLQEYFSTIHNQELLEDDDITKLKAAVWAVSLPGSTSNLFTTYRDVMGYATLRSIRRLRTYSADADPDEKGQEGVTVPETRITRTISIESDSSVDSNLWLSIRRNMSSTSLTEHDHQGTPNQPAPPRAFKPWSPHNRFVGLALPVDINMIFERCYKTGDSSQAVDTTKKLTEDSDEGRRLIRMEVLRLIVNLSSSVGLKGSEQGLLALKQRFPSTFKDVCFFSEACLILSTYSFRLNARRFIQELFDEIDITKLVEGPRSFLGIKDDEGPRMAPIRQDSLDSFRDFS
nr:hypothetical protein BaRGS_010739 [Batillaria attramentaria]